MSKRRNVNAQQRKEDYNEDEGDSDEIKYGIEKAPEDVMKKRRIIKLSDSK